jgi:sugar lactone lactonase YvrE
MAANRHSVRCVFRFYKAGRSIAELSLMVFPGPTSLYPAHKLRATASSGVRQLGRVLAVLAYAVVCSSSAAGQPSISFPATATVSQQSAPMVVTLTVSSSGTSGTLQALTKGVDGQDFVLVAGGTCASNKSYTVNQQCTVNVAVKPKYPGLRLGAVRLMSQGGTVMGQSLITASANGSLEVLAPGRIDTIAGNGSWIYHGDGVPAVQASIFLPTGVVEDAVGNLYFSDSSNNRIRRIDVQTGLISTVAGNGTPGSMGDNGPAVNAMISSPAGITMDGAGDLYFVDTGNHAVRRVDAVSGLITTVAGTLAVQGYSGDGHAATSATLSLPEGLALDASNNLFIADTGNNVIREVDASTGDIRTVAGTGIAGYNGDSRLATTATLNQPWNLAIASDTSLYIADLSNNRVRKVDAAGIISTVSGDGARGFAGDGSAASTAELNAPAAVTFDPAGNLYIADSGNNRVRKIYAGTSVIQTITGTDSEQFAGDGGAASAASLYGPYALSFSQAGDLLVADMFHNRLRRISATSITLEYATIRVSKTSSPQSIGLENDGNASLNLAAPVLINAALDPATTTCSTNTAIYPAGSCVLGVEFAPTSVGTLVTGQVALNSDAGNSPASIYLEGEVLSVEPTSVALSSSVNPSLVGGTVDFNATVTSADTSRSGAVTFFDGSTQLCQTTLTSAGTAACSISTLALGQHTITANYAGDANNASSVSTALIQVVKQPTSLTLTTSPNPAIVTQTVTLSVTASAAAGTPTGTVVFYDGSTALYSATLDASGNASYATAQLLPGTHHLSVQYAGDASDASGQSANVNEVIQQASTVTTLSSNNATSTVGDTVTFTASVVSGNGPQPTGSISFMEGTTILGSAAVTNAGTATLSLSTLPPGLHPIVAVYSGDTDNATSSSSAFNQTVQQITTFTTLASDNNPSLAGSTVHLNALVALPAGSTTDGTITGQVAFTDASTVLGTAIVDTTGHAVLSVSTLSVGVHNIIASYSGNTNYASSASSSLAEQVQQTSTQTVLTSSKPTVIVGNPVTFTASTSSSTGIPTGIVTFTDGSSVLGQAQLNAQGSSSLTVSNLSIGVHTVTASYGGDSNYLVSSSAGSQQTVVIATTALTLSGPNAPVDAGTPATFVSVLTTNGVSPTGSLTLRDGAVQIGYQPVSGAGQFNFSISNLIVGTHSITATYSGDSNNASSTSSVSTVIIRLAPTSTTVASNLNPATLGDSVTFTAQVASSTQASGTINFIDGTSVLGAAPLANGVATLTVTSLSFGPHSISAAYLGDGNHAVSTSAAVNERVVQPTTEVFTSNLNPSAAGASVVLTAKLSGAAAAVPTGSVTFRDGGSAICSSTIDSSGIANCTTADLAVGSHTLTAVYQGDDNYSSATASLIQTVQNASTQISLMASANPATYGAPLALSASVTSDGGVATGSVQFLDGGASIGSAVINSNGVAVLTTSSLAPGPHLIIANYVGDGKASASASVPLSLSVRQNTIMSLGSSSNPSLTLSPITLTVGVTSQVVLPTGSITFFDGSTQLGTAVLDGTGHASLTLPRLAAGTHALQTTYSGDAANFASSPATVSEIVQLRGTTSTLTASQTDTSNPLQVTLIGVVRWDGVTPPIGSITFKTANATIGTGTIDQTGVATITVYLESSTTENVTASYSGDASYSASTSTATAISSGPAPQFTIQVDSPTVTLASKEHSVVNVTISSVKGFTDVLQLGCVGLPVDATCTFSTPQTSLAADGTSKVQLTIDTGDPLGAGAQAKNQSKPSSSALLCFMPGGLLLTLLLLPGRYRSKLGVLVVLCVVSVVLGITGCSGLSVNGTPAGSYTFKVSAAGLQTGANQTRSISLIVTP